MYSNLKIIWNIIVIDMQWYYMYIVAWIIGTLLGLLNEICCFNQYEEI